MNRIKKVLQNDKQASSLKFVFRIAKMDLTRVLRNLATRVKMR